MRRTAVLINDRELRLGKVAVPESVHVIQYEEAIFIRHPEGIRLPGGGIGVIFRETDVLIRTKLEPI